MHFIAFTCKEWKPNSLGRYGINSSASKTCFVIRSMVAHMLRLIIQNRFHFLLKYFSIRNLLSDVPSAPLFVDGVSIFVACAVEFGVGVPVPEDFSVSNLPLRALTIRRSYVCCSVCMRNVLIFTDSKHCFADDEKTALHEYLGLVPRPHYCARPMRFGSRGPRKFLRRLPAVRLGYVTEMH